MEDLLLLGREYGYELVQNILTKGDKFALVIGRGELSGKSFDGELALFIELSPKLYEFEELISHFAAKYNLVEYSYKEWQYIHVKWMDKSDTFMHTIEYDRLGVRYDKIIINPILNTFSSLLNIQ